MFGFGMEYEGLAFWLPLIWAALIAVLIVPLSLLVTPNLGGLIVAFTAEGVSRLFTAGRPRVDRIGDCDQGLANYMVVPVTKLFNYRGPNAEPEFDVVALIHELGHVFGAEHVADAQSVMNEDFGYRTITVERGSRSSTTLSRNSSQTRP